jgi:hypothetical protein
MSVCLSALVVQLYNYAFPKCLWRKTLGHHQHHIPKRSMDKKEDQHKNSHIQTKRDRHTDRETERQREKRQNLEFQILTRFKVKDIIRNKVC